MATMPAHFPRAETIPDLHPLNAVRADYLDGRCHYLALALAEQTGLELAVLWDCGQEPVPLHVFCCAALAGPAVDAYGVVDDPWDLLLYFNQEWNLARPEDPDVTLISRQELLELFCAGGEPDPEAMARARADLIRFGFTPSPSPSLAALAEPARPAPSESATAVEL